MLDAKDTQFRLAENGVISYQHLESNPLPGEAIAHLEKGDHVLKPSIAIDDAKGVDAEALKTRLQAWFQGHLKTVLELLVALEEDNTFKEPTKEIISRVHEAMGIVPREALEDVIAKLDADDRKDLRAKRIRLGPILVFIPALNKPAAVKLRAMLWALYNGEALPAKTPNDGVVSCVVDGEAVNKDFYQAIGYPVYGPRAIRIDMLDRVICAVYDGADKGKFQAKHEMAEWLGTPIEDLYKILEAMGHKKVFDPADEAAKAEAEMVEQVDGEEPKAEEPKAEEAVVAVVEEKPESAAEESVEGKKEEVKPQVKPELATFLLKRGKAFEKATEGKTFKKPPFKKQEGGFKKQKNDQRKGKGKRNSTTNRSPKIMSAEAKSNPDDNPFAILGQLKK